MRVERTVVLVLAIASGCASQRPEEGGSSTGAPTEEERAELAMRACERDARVRNPALKGSVTFTLAIDREDRVFEMRATEQKTVHDDAFVGCVIDAVKGKRVKHRPMRSGITALESRLALRLHEGDTEQSMSIEAAPWRNADRKPAP